MCRTIPKKARHQEAIAAQKNKHGMTIRKLAPIARQKLKVAAAYMPSGNTIAQ
jgi:hypothetical protein